MTGMKTSERSREIFGGQAAAQLCLAKRKWCACGYRFQQADGPASPKDLSERNDVDYPQWKLGFCPECGRGRQLCRKVAVKGRLVCPTHGGRAGRKPLVPILRALDDDVLDEVASLMEAKNEELEWEFYAIKHMLQSVLSGYDPEAADLGFVERYAKLVETALGIKERRARLQLMGPRGESQKLEFSDPRVALVLKEKFKEIYASASRGTLSMVIDCVSGDEDLAQRLRESLPERLLGLLASPAGPPTMIDGHPRLSDADEESYGLAKALPNHPKS